MAAGEIHVGDVGLIFLVTIQDDTGPLDVSMATTRHFIFQRPDKSTLVATAFNNTDGTDGKLFYSTATGDLDQSGTWMFQAFLAIGGSQKYSDIGKFTVVANLI